MTTKETSARSAEGWTTRQRPETGDPVTGSPATVEGRDSVETGDTALAWGGTVSDGQGTGTSSRDPMDRADPQSPPVERGNEPRQVYRRSLRLGVDATDVNLGTPHRSPNEGDSSHEDGVGQLAPRCDEGGGVPVVVRERESRSHVSKGRSRSSAHGEGGQSDSMQGAADGHPSAPAPRPTRTKREDGRDSRPAPAPRRQIAQKQRALAVHAQTDPAHRFSNLYNLLHWEDWTERAADAVLSRPGSDTAGVDGTTRDYFKDHRDRLMAELREDLKRKRYEPLPVRRVHIPKARGKTRPLGIPALRDRIVQEALRMALDPIYESDFQPYSFGFRKGRRTMDAVAVLMPQFNGSIRKFYVIEGDLASYFDTVNHRKLLSVLKTRIKDRGVLDLIWKFLKAGVMEGRLFAKTASGVPQGGLLSPLLANVYLNEFDKWCENKWHRLTPHERQKLRKAGRGTYTVVRYADDFVVVTNDTREGVEKAKAEIQAFLETDLRLTLSEEKTKITHVNDGFDFLGFNIRRVSPEGRWVVHLRPTREGTERVKARIKMLTSRRFVLYDEVSMLTALNRIVRGWCEYYKHTSLHSDLEVVSRYTWHRYLLWLLKKHKGSRKARLVRDKTRDILGRTRWTATVREGGNALTVHQWLPSPKELARSTYMQKGRDGFGHPYLFAHEPTETGEPEGNVGVPESVYRASSGDRRHTGSPAEWQALRRRALVRDGYTCQTCGAQDHLNVHGTRGQKSRTLADFVTLCRRCHMAEHRREHGQKGE